MPTGSVIIEAARIHDAEAAATSRKSTAGQRTDCVPEKLTSHDRDLDTGFRRHPRREVSGQWTPQR